MTTSITTHKAKLKKVMIKAGVILIWLLLWQLAAIIVGSAFLFPSPAAVLRRLLELMPTQGFLRGLLFSLGRISLGCSLGVITGTLIGAATAFSKPLYEFMSPSLTMIKTTPVASFIILLLVWVKRGGIPIIIAFLMVVPVMWANVAGGIRNADSQLLEAAKIFRFTRRQKLKNIYIPETMPSFAAGCTTSIGFAWKAGIAAEVLSTPADSVGFNLYYARINLEYADLFAWTAAVIIMSFLLEKALVWALNRFVFTRGKYGRQ